MKKIVLSVVAVVAMAAVSKAQVRVGVMGGLNEEDQKINVTEGSIYGNGKFKSYHAGAIGDMKIGGNFYLQPQVLFSRKGATYTNVVSEKDTKIRINYVQLPVNVVYKLNLPFGKLFAGAGGSFSYAIGGRMSEAGVNTKLFKSGDWKREDVSLTFTGGIEFNNGLFISSNSQKGLMNINKVNGVTAKSRSVSVSVGYFIDWKKRKA